MHLLTRIKHAYKTEFLPRKSFMLERGDKNNNKKIALVRDQFIFPFINVLFKPNVSTSPWK